ncbi:hypothetical protein AGMMS50229_19640 [Campylobacterota bacterium]|nr:hypothetical protein AGMMS50229_19640 [Campylobacterota bacterium]
MIGLCDEIASLVRSGLPIEEALLSKSRDERNQLGKHLKKLADELGNGKALVDVVRDDPVFPPVYAAVIEAGIQSGNLAGALDSIVQSARLLRDSRVFLIQAALYPLVLFTSLWTVFTGMFLFVGPRFAAFFDEYQLTTPLLGIMKWGTADFSLALWVMSAVPAVLWLIFLVWCIRSARGNVIQSAESLTFFGWVPWLGQAVVQLQKMTFARIFAMLIKSSVPLDQAILLAAKATNDRYWSKESREQLLQRITTGKGENYSRSVISPLIIWAAGIPNQAILAEGLELSARSARTRADLLIAWCEMILPVVITFGFAVVIGVCYCLTVIWPYAQMLDAFSKV